MAGITWHSWASVLWLHKEGHEKKKAEKPITLKILSMKPSFGIT